MIFDLHHILIGERPGLSPGITYSAAAHPAKHGSTDRQVLVRHTLDLRGHHTARTHWCTHVRPSQPDFRSGPPQNSAAVWAGGRKTSD